MKYLKTDLLGKCIRWRQRGVCIVMKVEAVTETKVLGSNAIICERVKCDYLNSYTEVSNTKSTFTLYIDGDSINDVEIINEEVYNQLIELYRETNTSYNKLSNLAKYG